MVLTYESRDYSIIYVNYFVLLCFNPLAIADCTLVYEYIDIYCTFTVMAIYCGFAPDLIVEEITE